jgi:hypothetical protein
MSYSCIQIDLELIERRLTAHCLFRDTQFSRGTIGGGKDKRETYNNDLIDSTESKPQLQEHRLMNKIPKPAGLYRDNLRCFLMLSKTENQLALIFYKHSQVTTTKGATGSPLTGDQNSANDILCHQSSKHPFNCRISHSSPSPERHLFLCVFSVN